MRQRKAEKMTAAAVSPSEPIGKEDEEPQMRRELTVLESLFPLDGIVNKSILKLAAMQRGIIVRHPVPSKHCQAAADIPHVPYAPPPSK